MSTPTLVIAAHLGDRWLFEKRPFFHFMYGQCGPCVFQWNEDWVSVDLFDCRYFGCWCVRTFCFQFLRAEPTGGCMPQYIVYALQCAIFVVLALVRCVSSSVVPAGLEIWPAGPGLVAKLLTVEALQWFSHKGPHSETPVPSGKSDGALFPYQYYLYHVCGFRLLFLCIPFCLPGGF